MHKRSSYWKVVITLISIMILLNLIAFSKDFCDFYADRVYPVINMVIGTLTSWIPFAMGEMIMYIGALMLIALPVVAGLLLFLRKRKGYRNFATKYMKTVLMTGVVFLLLYTTNWFIPFRCHIVKVSDNTRTEYTAEEVAILRRNIVNHLNELADQVPRNEEGHLIYDYTQEDIFMAMRDAGDRFPRLKGHYSYAKPAMCSDFLDWMGIGGYNYIYTMEPTYNRYCDPLYLPVLIAHELSHHKGYYRENEAEFLSAIALAECDNPVLKYSAYREMYYYIDADYIDAVYSSLYPQNYELTEEDLGRLAEVLRKEPQLSQLVLADFQYAYEEGVASYEENANKFLEENFKGISEEVAETGWEIQGEVLKENSYDGITLLLLQYYFEQ